MSHMPQIRWDCLSLTGNGHPAPIFGAAAAPDYYHRYARPAGHHRSATHVRQKIHLVFNKPAIAANLIVIEGYFVRPDVSDRR